MFYNRPRDTNLQAVYLKFFHLCWSSLSNPGQTREHCTSP